MKMVKNFPLKPALNPFLVVLGIVTSCHQDVITLDLDPYDSIVIEAVLDDQSRSAIVNISRPSDLDRQYRFRPVDDAVVILSNNIGHSERLLNSEPGVYRSRFIWGYPGITYDLSVKVDGIEYAASSTMPQAIELDTCTPIPLENDAANYLLTCTFTDREGVQDFGRLKVYHNGDLFEDLLYHDQFSDGDKIVFEDIGAFHRTADVLVEMITMDEATFAFYSCLYDVNDYVSDQENDAFEDEYDARLPSFFPITLFNPPSNFSNGALGYFSVQAVRYYRPVFD